MTTRCLTFNPLPFSPLGFITHEIPISIWRIHTLDTLPSLHKLYFQPHAYLCINSETLLHVALRFHCGAAIAATVHSTESLTRVRHLLPHTSNVKG